MTPPDTATEIVNEPQDSFAKRTLWLSTARLLALVLSFILPFLLARRLSTTEFGLYKQTFQILLTSLTLLGLQVHTGIYSFMPRHPEKKAQIALNAILVYATLGGAVFAWFSLRPTWVNSAFHDGALAPVMPLLGLAILFWLVASAFESVMIADHDVRTASVLAVFLQLLKTGSLLGAALWFGNIKALVWAAVIFGAVHCSLFLIYLYRRFGRFWWPFDGQLLKAQMADALPFGIGAFAFSWQYDLHNYFVMHYFDAAAFAIYSTGCFQLPLLREVLDAMDTLLTPEIARLQKQGDYELIARRWLDSVRTMALCFIPACVLMFVLRHELIIGLYTEKFADSVPIFGVMIFNTLLLINFTGSVMRAFEEMKYFRLKLYLALMPVTWGFLYFGVKFMGLMGVVVAVVLIRVIDVIISSIALSRRIGMTRAHLFEMTSLVRIALACVPGALLVWMMRPWLTVVANAAVNPKVSTLLVLMAGGVVFALLFVPSAFICGAVGEKEKSWLRCGWQKISSWSARLSGLATA